MRIVAHRYPDRRLLRELEPAAEGLLNRHLSVAKEWMPQDYIPWRLGRDFDREPWTPDQARLSSVAQVAFELSLLTEDNLPSYHHQLLSALDGVGAWNTWSHRWAAEEARHSFVIRNYLLVTRNIDPIMLERRRMATMELGSLLPQKPVLRTLAYAALQEFATRICHRNTGQYSGDPVASRIMNRIAIDENLHMIFYRDVVTAALEVDPSGTVEAIAREVISFTMPGIGIQEFAYRARQIARAGIYDLRLHQEQVVWPLLRHWNVFGKEGLNASAERARLDLAAHLQRIDRLVCRLAEKRSGTGDAQPARSASPDRGAKPLGRRFGSG